MVWKPHTFRLVLVQTELSSTSESTDILWWVQSNYALISVKPEGGVGGGGRAIHGNLTVTYIPRVGILIGPHAFDLTISTSRREVNHLFQLIFTIIFLPRGGDFDYFLENVKNPTLCSAPPPLGLDIDRCINFGSWKVQGLNCNLLF